MAEQRLAGDWVTNTPKTIKGYWPRRNAKMREGPPMRTETYTQAELENRGLVGVYLDEDIPEGLRTRDVVDATGRVIYKGSPQA